MSGPVLVFDSGLGGLTVLAALRRRILQADYLYVADDAGFPYGVYEDEALTSHVVANISNLIAAHQPAMVVIACNSASTLVLPQLRARFNLPFVGTVPAIKPAVASTRSGLVSVLATPGTVARDYTRALIKHHGGKAQVTLVGCSSLAGLAEAAVAGGQADNSAIALEITPAFVRRGAAMTDQVVLACTHYPLLLDVLRNAAPWPVAWIDPAQAIARRAHDVLGTASGSGECRFMSTSGVEFSDRARSVLERLIDTGRGAL